MSARISPLAGTRATLAQLVDVGRLVDAYFGVKPDSTLPTQRVAFGTSGHRGSSFDGSFNEDHIVAICAAVCAYRGRSRIDGPLFIGIDTHALSTPALQTALEVLVAHGVDAVVSQGTPYTPTPAISHAILRYNRGRTGGFADGIVVTPSHNPPDSGGIKYNPPNGGPAESDITRWIQDHANALLATGVNAVPRMPFERARRQTREHDYVAAYVDDLGSVLDFDVIRGSRIRMGVDPLGGAGVHYWARIAERYAIELDVVSDAVDPQFAFMTLDWDGKIRFDPSSRYAMERLIALEDRYDIAFACDTDHDRHGIVTRSASLLPPNHYLSVAVDYLFSHRPQWSASAVVGKTVVSSAMIDRVAARLGRQLFDAPVGFKWFVDGLVDGTLGFGGEESAGATFLRRDGGVWTTDKDGIACALLAAEITARRGRDPGLLYRDLCAEFGEVFADRVDARATPAQKQMLAQLTPARIRQTELAGEPIIDVRDTAPGNGAAIGGIKVAAQHGWFAARPSGTEDIYKIYAESWRDAAHLQRILEEAQRIVDAAIAGA